MIEFNFLVESILLFLMSILILFLGFNKKMLNRKFLPFFILVVLFLYKIILNVQEIYDEIYYLIGIVILIFDIFLFGFLLGEKDKGNKKRKKNKRNIIKFIFLIFVLFLFVNQVLALSATMHVPEKYNSVEPGERLYFEISVKYPENPTRIDLRLNYEVKDLNGNLIAQGKALKAVETQASFVDFIVLPASAQPGVYSIDVIINDYGDMNEIVGSSFEISRGYEEKLMTYIYILGIGIIFLSILVIFVLFRKRGPLS